MPPPARALGADERLVEGELAARLELLADFREDLVFLVEHDQGGLRIDYPWHKRG